MDKEERIGSIQYYLKENPFCTGDSNRYTATVKRKEVMRQDQIVTLMTRKNTTISREEIKLVLSQYKQVVIQQLQAGYPVITDLFQAQVTIRGGFADGGDEFDSRRHYVNMSLSPNNNLRRELNRTTTVQKISDREKRVRIFHLYDYATRSVRNEFPLGGLVNLKGSGFLSDGGDPEIYLCPSGTDKRIHVSRIYSSTARNILFGLPDDLEPGDYRVKLVVVKGLTRKEVEYKDTVSIG